MTPRTGRDIWGFGPIGWFGLAILGAVLAIEFLGPGLRLGIMSIIMNRLGWDALEFFVTRVIVFQSLALTSAQVSLVTAVLCGVPIWMGWQKHRLLKYLGFVALCFLSVYLLVSLVLYHRSIFYPIVALEREQFFLIVTTACTLAFATMFAVATRSVLVAVAWTAAALIYPICSGFQVDVGFTSGGRVTPINAFGVLFHVLTAGSLAYWAIWIHKRPSGAALPCRKCGYELLDLREGAPCPECGHTRPLPLATEPDQG